MKGLRQIILCISLVSLYGCFGSGEEDVHTFVENIKKNAKGKVNQLPPMKAPIKADFTAQDLRSPFVMAKRTDKFGSLSQLQGGAAVPQQAEQAPRPDADRKREFLEQYSLDSLEMVGSISKGNYIWGLIKNNDGLIFPVKVGDYIGLNSGYITQINEKKITIEETIENGQGGWMHATTELDLQTSQEPEHGRVNTLKKGAKK